MIFFYTFQVKFKDSTTVKLFYNEIKITTISPFNRNEIEIKERHSSTIDLARKNITLLTSLPILIDPYVWYFLLSPVALQPRPMASGI